MTTFALFLVIVASVGVALIVSYEIREWSDFYRGKRFRARDRFPVSWNRGEESWKY